MILNAKLASKLAFYHTDQVWDFECMIAHASVKGKTSIFMWVSLTEDEKKYLTDAGYKIKEKLARHPESGNKLVCTTISWE